jgi:hypothetical protein
MDGSMDRVQVRTDEQLVAMKRLQERRQLPARQDKVSTLLDDLDGALDTLAELLRPLLRPQGPSPLYDSGEEPETELAAFLDGTAQRLGRAVTYVRDLTDRVDL